MCIGKNVTLNPMNIIQKLALAERFVEHAGRVIFGNQ